MLCHPNNNDDFDNKDGDDSNNDLENKTFMSAEEWFAGGQHVHFDPNHKKITPRSTSNTIRVFERVVHGEDQVAANGNISSSSSSSSDSNLWISFLPSFPDGSYGYAKVERLLNQSCLEEGGGATRPSRLYIEFVGQGDSEKPVEYNYGTMERADLVQAQWKAHGVARTVVVTMGYSSLVLLELLRRQQGKHQNNNSSTNCTNTIIQHVLCINGAWYADAAPSRHRLWLQPFLLQSRRVGHWSASLAQRSNLVLTLLLRPYTSHHSYYHHHNHHRRGRRLWQLPAELRETEKAIRRHGGTTAFLAQASSVLTGQEHADWAQRWDLSVIFFEYAQATGITFDIVASQDDVWQGTQMALVQERLGQYNDSIRTTYIPGGHLLATAQAPLVCRHIQALYARAHTSTATHPVGKKAPTEPWIVPQVPYGLASSG